METEEHTAVNGHLMVYKVVIRNGERTLQQWDAEHSDSCRCVNSSEDSEPLPDW